MKNDDSLTSFKLNEVCPKCGNLHFSKFRHEAENMLNTYHRLFPGGAGYAFNTVEHALGAIYERGYKDGKGAAK